MATAINDQPGSTAGAQEELDSPLQRLTEVQIEAIGEEFDAIYDEVKQSLGGRDAAYIRSIIGLQRRLALLGRALLVESTYPPAWLAGTSVLGMAKILENLEIGHNVMHGQWDWMNDPVINSRAWDWDTASTAEAWRHSHNYIHHTYTNIRGLDKDLGYEIMRIDPHQPWHPVYLLQPIYNLVLMALFEWGVALHDMDIEAFFKRDKPVAEVWADLKGISGKAWLQIRKDYLAWPILSAAVTVATSYARTATGTEDRMKTRLSRRPANKRSRLRGRRHRADSADALALALTRGRQTYKRTLWAGVTANIIRNVWAYGIIFCGHFPDQTYTFSQDETAEESRGAKYIRQLLGAANIDGSPLFHVISGNLGYQVEHHLYPDMPSTRYGEIAPKVREICERYELPYNTGPLHNQLAMVQRSILRLAFPGGRARPTPPPYQGPKYQTDGEQQRQAAAAQSR
jgi:linoleoyl-CoA desaturase